MPTHRPAPCAASTSRGILRSLLRAALAVLAAVGCVLVSALGPFSPAAAADGWGWPLEPPQVVNEFDPPDDPYGSGHRGVDLAGSAGQVVVAPSSGAVTFAGAIAGRGVVVVDHGSVRSTFEPVVAEVVVGATVGAGDQLGTLQAFGHHCGLPCLHWGAIEGDTYLDPLDFVGAGPSRLLPWWDDDALRAGAIAVLRPVASRRQVLTDGLSALASGGPPTSVLGGSPPTELAVTSRPGSARSSPAGAPEPDDALRVDDDGTNADTGMAAAAVLALVGGMLAGRVVLRVLRGRR